MSLFKDRIAFQAGQTSARVKRMTPLLGTFARVQFYSEGATQAELDALADQCFYRLRSIQQQMNYFEEQSLVARFNALAIGESIEISDEMKAVLEFAEELRAESEGLFNVGLEKSHELNGNILVRTGAHEINLNGVAKGFAVDYAYQLVAEHPKAASIFGSINAGGDVRVFEKALMQLPIKIELGEKVFYRTLPVQRDAVATSSFSSAGSKKIYHKNATCLGTAENPVRPKSASVVAPRAMVSDALTKVLLLAETAEEKKVAERCLRKYSARGFCETE